jgi:hypothetical protein
MSLQHHVPGFKGKSNHPHFIVARHHFQRALLECRPAWNIKIGTTFLSREQAELVAGKDFGNGKFTENCNKVSKLLAKAGRSASKPADGNNFTQAPVATTIEVEDFVKTLLPPSTSFRLWRRKERLVQAEQESMAETVEKPRIVFTVTPNTLLSNFPPILIRPTPTLPYQPEDRGIPVSLSATNPLPNSPDRGLSIDLCQEKLKKKFELCDNDPKVCVPITTLLFACIR